MFGRFVTGIFFFFFYCPFLVAVFKLPQLVMTVLFKPSLQPLVLMISILWGLFLPLMEPFTLAPSFVSTLRYIHNDNH